MFNKKISISIMVIGSAIILVLTLWELPILLIAALLVISFLKHKYSPIKKELHMFIICAIIGSLGESLIMLSGPWAYASSQIVNFPVWLPFLWGLAGITGITIYESILGE